jgi:hypothetical protein
VYSHDVYRLLIFLILLMIETSVKFGLKCHEVHPTIIS